MKYGCTTAMCMVLFAVGCGPVSEPDRGPFPVLEGWTCDGDVKTYDPDTLFEYINGAAETYIHYGFTELKVQDYVDRQERMLTVEIYRHDSPANGFGIYSSEKAPEGPFLDIGGEGYADEGILYFVKGPYYVKLNAFDLGGEGKAFLESTARKISDALEGNSTLPATLKCLPETGRVRGSEQYVNVNYQGYSFLHSAYTAEYEIDDRSLKFFILEGKDPEEAKSMMDQYVSFARDKGSQITEGEIVRFEDPYNRSGGAVNLKPAGRFVAGAYTDDAATAESLLQAARTCLEPKVSPNN